MAVLDGCKLGRTLLTFLVIDTSSYQATRTLLQFTSRKEAEELHTVAGDGCVFIERAENLKVGLTASWTIPTEIRIILHLILAHLQRIINRTYLTRHQGVFYEQYAKASEFRIQFPIYGQ